jgi:hypothetical protein
MKHLDRSPSQKLAILRSETRIPLQMLRGYAALTKDELTKLDKAPENVIDWVDKVIAAADDLNEILEILTGSQCEF